MQNTIQWQYSTFWHSNNKVGTFWWPVFCSPWVISWGPTSLSYWFPFIILANIRKAKFLNVLAWIIKDDFWFGRKTGKFPRGTPPACGVQGWLGALKSRLSDQIYQISPPLYLTNASGPNLLQNFEYKITWQCLLTFFVFCKGWKNQHRHGRLETVGWNYLGPVLIRRAPIILPALIAV